MSVFGDTSGFLSLLVENDPHHAEAADVWREVIDADLEVITTNYVVVETIALLHRRFGITGVRRFADKVLPALSITYVDESTHTTSVIALLASSREGPGLVDRVSFHTIDRLHLERSFAFDRHFEERGYVRC